MTTITDARSARTAKAAYDQDGWYQQPETLDPALLAALKDSVERISAQDRPEVVREHGTDVVRAVHGCHRFDEVCEQAVRHPLLLDLACELIGGPVYVYQFKVNLKQAFEGASWPWHQDFAFWHREDGMAAPDAVSIAVFLDEVRPTNGPLELIPTSHRLGLLGPDAAGPGAAGPSGDWRRHVSADLEHTVPADLAEALAAEHGRKVATGPAGTCLAFHPSIVHCSSDNRSPDRRAVLLITYNSVANAPANPTRPAFLVDRDTTPLAYRAGTAQPRPASNSRSEAPTDSSSSSASAVS